MPFVTSKDGTQIYYKDWGTGQPVVFSHGWPLSADDWDTQMMFFLTQGYRVIAHDRRGHGRSDQTWDGNEMDHYADDLARWSRTWICRTRSTSATPPAAARSPATSAGTAERVAKAVLISAVPPIMVQSDKNPEGTPIEVFDGFRRSALANRSQFYRDIASLPVLRLQPAGRKARKA